MTTRTDAISDRMGELGIELPPVGASAGNYVPFVRTGNLLFISGQVAKDSGGSMVVGRVGETIDETAAKAAARNAGLHVLAVARQALGSLDRVVRVVKLNGYVNALPTFTRQPSVMNGCSDLMVEVFGDRGRHARAAVGAPTLPGGAPIEVEAILEVE